MALIFHYKLEDGSGSTATDEQSSHNGTLYNSPTWTTGINSSGGLNFVNTDNECIEVADHADLDVTSDYTYMMWIKPSGTHPNRACLFRKEPNGGLGWGCEALTANSLNFGGGWKNGSGAQGWSTINFYLTADKWQHFAVIKDGDTMTVYVNGKQVSTVTETGQGTMSTNAANLDIMGWRDYSTTDDNRYMNGDIDNVRFYDSAETEATLKNIIAEELTFGKYAEVTIDNTKVAGTANHTDFPVKVSGTYDGTASEPNIKTTGNSGNVENTASGGNSGSVTIPADLIFTDDASKTTKYDHEIVSYNAATGAIEAWVRIPTLDYNDDTTFYMHYGNSDIDLSLEDVAGTWTNFQNVYHFNEGSGTTVNDSTGNSDGTLGQSDNWGTGEYNFDGVDDYCSTGITTAPNDFSIFAIGKTSATGEKYIYGTQNTTTTNYLFQRLNNGNTDDRFGSILYQSGSGVYADDSVTGPNYNDGSWHLMGSVYKGTASPDEIYYIIDGTVAETGNYGAQNNTTYPWSWDSVYIAARNLNSAANNPTPIDVQGFFVYEGLVDSDFTTTFYNTVLDTANFYTMGSETGGNANPNAPTVTAPSDTATGVSINPAATSSAFDDDDVGDTHQASQWLLSDDSGFTSTEWDSGTDTTNKTSIDINATDGTFGGALAGETALAYETQYWLKVRHQDNNDAWSDYSTAISFTTGAAPSAGSSQNNKMGGNLGLNRIGGGRIL